MPPAGLLDWSGTIDTVIAGELGQQPFQPVPETGARPLGVVTIVGHLTYSGQLSPYVRLAAKSDSLAHDRGRRPSADIRGGRQYPLPITRCWRLQSFCACRA